jgi:hypothetical protein
MSKTTPSTNDVCVPPLSFPKDPNVRKYQKMKISRAVCVSQTMMYVCMYPM